MAQPTIASSRPHCPVLCREKSRSRKATKAIAVKKKIMKRPACCSGGVGISSTLGCGGWRGRSVIFASD